MNLPDFEQKAIKAFYLKEMEERAERFENMMKMSENQGFMCPAMLNVK